MAGRRRLTAGMPRLLGHHGGHLGRIYRREWAALAVEYDLSRPLAQLQAGRACVAAVNLDASTRALAAARRARERESGRRPSTRDVERLARRQGLDEQAYASALSRLQAVAPKSGPVDIAQAIQAARQAHEVRP